MQWMDKTISPINNIRYTVRMIQSKYRIHACPERHIIHNEEWYRIVQEGKKV